MTTFAFNVYTIRVMSRTSKYKGGSKVVSFRLPIEGYKSVRIRIQALLDEIAKEELYRVEKSVKSTLASAETRLSDRLDYNIIYQCGCTVTDGLFRRVSSCKLERLGHRNIG
jgi:hypothetical protein